MPRDQFVELFADLVNEITDHHAFDLRDRLGPDGDRDQRSGQQQALRPRALPERGGVPVGGALTFTVKPDLDCFLTLINVDQKGRTTVLFPNKFNQNNKVLANQELKVPGAEIGGFKLIFRDPGKETVIAKCNASGNRLPRHRAQFRPERLHHLRLTTTTTSRRALDPKKRQIVVVGTGESGSSASEQPATPHTLPPEEPTPGYEAPPADYDADVDIVAEQGIVLKVQP